MIEGFVVVSKEEAKQMIDNAPGDTVIITTMDLKNFFHEKNKTKSKNEGKILIDLAKEVGYQNNDIFGMIYLEKEKNIERHIVQNILFPQIE